jgi:pyridoxamine 5'-phosphate oxidase
MNLADLRKDYTLNGLRRAELATDPVVQFNDWLQTAIGADVLEPTVMTLATADAAGAPSSRIVLLKGVDERGFQFFTNYGGRKARELAANPQAALTIHWRELERQVCVAGAVSKLSWEESEQYFRLRPRGSQIAAWASAQSEEVASRGALEAKFAEFDAKFQSEDVPLPDNWGGYVLWPARIEFWQGRQNRLHDRLCYEREDEGWRIVRLSP